MREPKDLLGPMRLPFLVLPPACVLLGIGAAVWSQGQINVWHAILAFVGAVAAEYTRGRELRKAGQVGLGTWLGMVLGAVAKIALVMAMLGVFAVAYFF